MGFSFKNHGVQKLHRVLENLWGALLFGGGLVGEWKLWWGIFPWGLLEGAVNGSVDLSVHLKFIAYLLLGTHMTQFDKCSMVCRKVDRHVLL